MKHLLIPVEDHIAWERALTDIPHMHAHTHWYNEIMQIAAKQNIFLYLGQAADFKVICPLFIRYKTKGGPGDIATPYGFSGFSATGSCDFFADEWYAFMRSNQFVCGHIALHPLLQYDTLYSATDVYPGKKAYYLNLRRPLELIYKNFAASHRHSLRQLEKNPFTILQVKDKKFVSAFIDLYQIMHKKRQASSVYDFGQAAWERLIATEHATLYTVLVNDTVEAAAVFIAYKTIADYFMTSSTDAGRKYSRAILWQAMKDYHIKGMEWLHLGCGIRENDTLEQFKYRFGGDAHTTYALKQVYDEKTYHQLCAIHYTDPSNRHGYFPSYWASNHQEN